MALRDIRIWPDPILSTPTAAVTAVDASVRALVADMFDTMAAADGIGLAANQVGESRSILVIDLDADRACESDPELAAELKSWGYTGPIALINPKITHGEGVIEWEEGCLSVPGITELVRRHAQVTVSYLDAQGAAQTLVANDLFAVCLQHEMDHLLGRVFLAYLSPAKRLAARRKMLRIKRVQTAAAQAAQSASRRRAG